MKHVKWAGAIGVVALALGAGVLPAQQPLSGSTRSASSSR